MESIDDNDETPNERDDASIALVLDHHKAGTERFFKYGHLPPRLQGISRRFAKLAAFLVTLPANHERDKALDALLVAKDAAVRSRL